MIQKLLFSILIISISFSGCKAQTTHKTNTTMETFSKKINNLELKMLVNTDIKERKTSWDIYIYNSKRDSVLLDHFEHPKIYEKAHENISGDIRKHIIIGDVILDNETIYLTLYKHGKTYLNTYEFKDYKKFIKNEYFGGQLATGSYLNFGHPFYDTEIKILSDNKIYINFHGGTEVFSGNGSVTLLMFDKYKKKLAKVIFKKTTTKVIKDNEKLFETLNLNNKEKIHLEIRKVLIESNSMNKNDNFNYIDFMYDHNVKTDLEQFNKITGGTIYFFYQTNKYNSIQIIRYDNYENEWLIGDFKEELINL